MAVLSEFILIIGVVFLAGALGMLWNIHMSTHAQPAGGAERDDTDAGLSSSEADLGRFRSMPGLAPAAPASALDPSTDAPVSALAQESVAEEPILATTVESSDHPDVALHLTLAEQLKAVGDQEGTSIYAEMVIDDPRASPGQVAQAQALLRRDNIA